jgi:cell division septum initiation protein DivIVA
MSSDQKYSEDILKHFERFLDMSRSLYQELLEENEALKRENEELKSVITQYDSAKSELGKLKRDFELFKRMMDPRW